jgi:hypothetical protein
MTGDDLTGSASRRRANAEADHCRDGTGRGRRPDRDRQVALSTGPLPSGRVRPIVGEAESLAREADQLELAIETLEADQAERLAAASPAIAAAIETAVEAQKPARRPLPEHLPREEVRHRAPGACPSCGGVLRRIGEDVTETLDYVPGRFKVARHIREKLSKAHLLARLGARSAGAGMAQLRLQKGGAAPQGAMSG